MPRLSLRLRLNLLITALMALVLAAGAAITVHNARSDVQAEVESTASLALHLLDAELAYYREHYAPLNSLQRGRHSVFNLRNLGTLRHLRIEFVDTRGELVDSNHDPGLAADARAPAWFERLLGANAPVPSTTRTVYFGGQAMGTLRVTPDPTAEIAEIWSDTVGQLALVGVLFVVINLLVYAAVGRALQPVQQILAALVKLEQGRLGTRLPEFELPEMAGIGRRFNTMAGTLEQTLGANRRLTQRIVRLQEDERKALARDLHDEIGQSLTAISIESAAIERAPDLATARAGGAAIAGACRQTMALVRDMLYRLRPDALDQLGLAAALRDLAEQWRQRNPQIVFATAVEDDLHGHLDEEVAMTLYRAAQECLSNALRHAAPGYVVMRLVRHAERVELVVRDDGRGFDAQAATPGYGLAGMRERAEGLGGTVAVDGRPGNGTTVRVVLPCRVRAAVEAAA